ncbi:MAG: hypothetical protein IT212_07500 [Bacteroidia bacterium]|nr:hypothetical protein [Bacteroidia bacterium]
MFFGWGNIKKLLIELLKTFSNEKSFLSSKRINRFLFLITGLSLSIFIIIYNRGKWGALECMIVIGALFGYAGYEMTKTQKEKLTKKEDESENN